jgi:phosphoglycerate dehydrogenase-like enzyme
LGIGTVAGSEALRDDGRCCHYSVCCRRQNEFHALRKGFESLRVRDCSLFKSVGCTVHHCAILDDYQGCSLDFADWSSLRDVQVKNFTEVIGSPAALAEQLAGFEIVVAMRERTRFDASLLARLPRLKLLVTTGMRNAAIDVGFAVKNGITVCGTRSLSHPTPELTWGLLLALARHIAADVVSVRSGEKWQTRIGIGLSGKTLGIVGLGKIGRQIARYARAFEMPVLAWSRNLTHETCQSEGVERAASLDDLLQRSDIVTLHLVLSDSTRGMIGARELALLRPTALLINTSRSPLIDEVALVEALAQNRIAGAALDVYDTEPLPHGHPLRTLPNVLATAHIGYVTRENYQIFYTDAVEDIKAWLEGAPVRTLDSPAAVR